MIKARTKRKIKDIRYNLIWQPLLCMLFMYLVLWTLHSVAHEWLLWAAGASSLASTAYIIFVTPDAYVAKSSRVIGGYFIALVVSELVGYLFRQAFHLLGDNYLAITFPHIYWLSAILAVGISIFLMVILDLQHPPAAGLGLVTILDVQSFYVLFVLFASAAGLSLIRQLLGKRLKNLI